MRGDHFSGKPGSVREFDRCEGNAGKSDRETCPLVASRFGLRQCLVNFYGSTFVTLLKDLFANIKTF